LSVLPDEEYTSVYHVPHRAVCWVGMPSSFVVGISLVPSEQILKRKIAMKCSECDKEMLFSKKSGLCKPCEDMLKEFDRLEEWWVGNVKEPEKDGKA
jgi:hypothetical protein